ncbi:hypothetical protein PCANC_12816 [Puccinia coronata f. sp. avenae]|uniref:CRAL-TRIO domain-containing protein n=1 Tax=Puccinia coronata f. sp. avenae TaxID=200324 RepID=A0A2N5T078_9BASI|nr:hypothetical protein PCANC_12816 [Puccinia coronata f. sp. avenae]
MANQPQPATELEYFPTLNESQLTDLKTFWQILNQALTPHQQANKLKDKATQEQADSVIKKLITSSEERGKLSKELWEWIMMDDPDVMVLKYIRAKKFKSSLDSIELLINSLKFRAERNLSQIYTENTSILKQLKTAKAFVFGFDKSGSPIFRVNAAKHKTNDQSPSELEAFILYSMEMTRLFILPPAETVTMLVDLSGFGMSNMDWKCTSFMISTLESYYPETLNHQIIHNAPWIFQGLWKAISTMIDPVVRSKVLFTSKNEDLFKLVDKQNLFKAEGGESEFQWAIPANHPLEKGDPASPSANGECDVKLSPEQEEAKIKELETRPALVAHFLSLTQLWLAASDNNSPPEKVVKILALRDLLKLILRAQYLKMIPLIKPKTIYHYREILKHSEPGIINFEAGSTASGASGAEQASTNESVWRGHESARPSLLKTIELRTSLFRSTYLASPSSSEPLPEPAPSTDPLSTEEDPIEKIFSEITRLDF